MTQPAQNLTIDIVSDVVCPWCIIGYKQMETAIARLDPSVAVTLRWHPFELVPGMVPGGQNVRDYSRERYGATPEQGLASRKRMSDIGAQLGIDFRWDSESRIYNTHKAHQLLMWAGETGGQTPLKLALFNAYFTEQANISDDAVLLDAVKAAGLNVETARAVLADARYAPQVSAEIEYWQDQNVTGVPAYVVNGKYMIPGAQDPDIFERIFERALAA